MQAGYSKRALADKLGLKSSHKGLLVNPPPNYIQYIEPLPTGVVVEAVDVKICAIDNDWSGLKFVYRQADRPHSANYATNN